MARFQKNPVTFTLLLNQDELNILGTVLDNVVNIDDHLSKEFTQNIYQNMTNSEYDTDGSVTLCQG